MRRTDTSNTTRGGRAGCVYAVVLVVEAGQSLFFFIQRDVGYVFFEIYGSSSRSVVQAHHREELVVRIVEPTEYRFNCQTVPCRFLPYQQAVFHNY